jgi:hypothetical protein
MFFFSHLRRGRSLRCDLMKVFLFFFLDKKEPKNQENLTLANALAALPAKFTGRRARIPKEIFLVPNS